MHLFLVLLILLQCVYLIPWFPSICLCCCGSVLKVLFLYSPVCFQVNPLLYNSPCRAIITATQHYRRLNPRKNLKYGLKWHAVLLPWAKRSLPWVRHMGFSRFGVPHPLPRSYQRSKARLPMEGPVESFAQGGLRPASKQVREPKPEPNFALEPEANGEVHVLSCEEDILVRGHGMEPCPYSCHWGWAVPGLNEMVWGLSHHHWSRTSSCISPATPMPVPQLLLHWFP